MLWPLDFGYLSFKNNYQVVLECNQEISNFYRSLIPKYLHARPQRHQTHITVVRGEVPEYLEKWYHLAAKKEGERVPFQYDREVQYANNYFWLNCFSPPLLDLRIELGLPNFSKLIRPPDDSECFHLTIGNNKGKI